MSVQWGILSTARINDQFLAGLQASGTGHAVAIASRDAERATAYARERAIPRAYGSYEALLEDPEVQAIYVSLPNGLHPEWAQRALEAGKHVLCEKPLSWRRADAEAAFDAAQRAERVLMEAFMYRHHPQTIQLRRLVTDGAVGRLRLIRASFGFVLGNGADPRLSRALAGGALMDVGCYCVSAIRLLAGEPEVAAAQQITGGDGVDVAFAGVLTLPGEVLAHFDAGLVFAPGHSLEVIGEEGSLFIADPWHCRAPGIDLRRGERNERVEIQSVDPYMLQAENFAAAVTGAAAPLLDRDDALGQAATIEALYTAAETRRPVTLAP